METLYKDLGDKIQFIGINQGDKEEDMGKFIKEHKLSFPVVYDKDKKIASSFSARMPSQILIDIRGVIIYKEPETPRDIKKYMEKLF